MRKAWLLLFFSLLVGLGMNLAHPITPAHLRTINVSSNMFGIIFASMNVGQFLMAPVWGNLGDTKNRKMVMIIGLTGYAISQALFGYFTNIYLIILVRFSAGIFASALISNALAHISINKAFESKAKLISLFVAFNVLGSTLGYYIGGYLGDFYVGKEYMMMYIQAIFNIVFALLTLLFLYLPEEKQAVGKRQGALKQLSNLRHLSKPLFLLIVIMSLISVAQTNFSKYLDLYMTDLSYKSSQIGTLVFTTGIITLVMSFFVVPRLARYFKETHILIVVIFVQGLFSALTFLFDQSLFLVYAYSFFLVYTAAKAIYEPTMTFHLSKYTQASPGVLMGARTSAISLGAIIGPVLAGFIYDDLSNMMFVLLSALLVISGFLLYIYQRGINV